MADRLNSVIRALFILTLCTLMVSVRAQALLSDPTRPPAGISSPAADAGGVTGPVLQSVMIPKKGNASVVSGGKQVKLGQLYGDSRLIKLSEREAVLEGPGGIERLMLTPGIEKTNIIRKSSAAKRAQGGGKP